MQQNKIYNIPLPRGPGPKQNHKKKGNESGINYPGELKTLNSSQGHKISTRNGSVIGSDVTYRFLEYWIALRKVCSFRKTKQKWTTPFNHPREPVSSPLYFR
jgi:hypothetical protein